MSNISAARRDALCKQIIDGRPVAEWDKKWFHVADWRTNNTDELKAARGIVRLSMNGEVVFIGRASDNKRGIVKKFRDLVRSSDSSRRHYAGRLAYKHRNELTVDVIITAEYRQAEHINFQLKSALVELYAPAWSASNIM